MILDSYAYVKISHRAHRPRTYLMDGLHHTSRLISFRIPPHISPVPESVIARRKGRSVTSYHFTAALPMLPGGSLVPEEVAPYDEGFAEYDVFGVEYGTMVLATYRWDELIQRPYQGKREKRECGIWHR